MAIFGGWRSDLVFVGQAGGYLDGRALRRSYDSALKRADLRKLRSTTFATPSAPA
jgi:hypothetical protein